MASAPILHPKCFTTLPPRKITTNVVALQYRSRQPNRDRRSQTRGQKAALNVPSLLNAFEFEYIYT